METSNKDLSNYYNSYGPMIGKVCENTDNYINTNFFTNSNLKSELGELGELGLLSVSIFLYK